EEGTLITKEENIMEAPLVSGIALDRNQARISLMGVIDRPGIASDIFNKLATSEVNVDMIIQNKAHDGATNIDFTVPMGDLHDAKTIVDTFIQSGEIKDDSYNEDICKVSVVGVGMRSHTGVAAKAFSTMADNNININMISTSEIKISMVIDEKYAELAVRGLHDAYELDK
ncbi:MAG: ACT domain-containing protein, partial [Campylobacterota bacterium]|nr:ACT domain-containing protein [Campylobacterota bacterium]